MLTMLALRLGKMFDEAEIDRLVEEGRRAAAAAPYGDASGGRRQSRHWS